MPRELIREIMEFLYLMAKSQETTVFIGYTGSRVDAFWGQSFFRGRETAEHGIHQGLMVIAPGDSLPVNLISETMIPAHAKRDGPVIYLVKKPHIQLIEGLPRGFDMLNPFSARPLPPPPSFEQTLTTWKTRHKIVYGLFESDQPRTRFSGFYDTRYMRRGMGMVSRQEDDGDYFLFGHYDSSELLTGEHCMQAFFPKDKDGGMVVRVGRCIEGDFVSVGSLQVTPRGLHFGKCRFTFMPFVTNSGGNINDMLTGMASAAVAFTIEVGDEKYERKDVTTEVGVFDSKGRLDGETSTRYIGADHLEHGRFNNGVFVRAGGYITEKGVTYHADTGVFVTPATPAQAALVDPSKQFEQPWWPVFDETMQWYSKIKLFLRR